MNDLPNGAGYKPEVEDVWPVCTGHDECECDEDIELEIPMDDEHKTAFIRMADDELNQ